MAQHRKSRKGFRRPVTFSGQTAIQVVPRTRIARPIYPHPMVLSGMARRLPPINLITFGALANAGRRQYHGPLPPQQVYLGRVRRGKLIGTGLTAAPVVPPSRVVKTPLSPAAYRGSAKRSMLPFPPGEPYIPPARRIARPTYQHPNQLAGNVTRHQLPLLDLSAAPLIPRSRIARITPELWRSHPAVVRSTAHPGPDRMVTLRHRRAHAPRPDPTILRGHVTRSPSQRDAIVQIMLGRFSRFRMPFAPPGKVRRSRAQPNPILRMAFRRWTKWRVPFIPRGGIARARLPLLNLTAAFIVPRHRVANVPPPHPMAMRGHHQHKAPPWPKEIIWTHRIVQSPKGRPAFTGKVQRSRLPDANPRIMPPRRYAYPQPHPVVVVAGRTHRSVFYPPQPSIQRHRLARPPKGRTPFAGAVVRHPFPFPVLPPLPTLGIHVVRPVRVPPQVWRGLARHAVVPGSGLVEVHALAKRRWAKAPRPSVRVLRGRAWRHAMFHFGAGAVSGPYCTESAAVFSAGAQNVQVCCQD